MPYEVGSKGDVQAGKDGGECKEAEVIDKADGEYLKELGEGW